MFLGWPQSRLVLMNPSTSLDIIEIWQTHRKKYKHVDLNRKCWKRHELKEFSCCEIEAFDSLTSYDQACDNKILLLILCSIEILVCG